MKSIHSFSLGAIKERSGTVPKCHPGRENPAVYSGIMLAEKQTRDAQMVFFFHPDSDSDT